MYKDNLEAVLSENQNLKIENKRLEDVIAGFKMVNKTRKRIASKSVFKIVGKIFIIVVVVGLTTGLSGSLIRSCMTNNDMALKICKQKFPNAVGHKTSFSDNCGIEFRNCDFYLSDPDRSSWRKYKVVIYDWDIKGEKDGSQK